MGEASEQQQQQQQQQKPKENLVEPQNGNSRIDEISLESLRDLYLGNPSSENGRIGQMLRRGSASITYTTAPLEFPPVTRLDPLNKKRILVTGVSFSLNFHHAFNLIPIHNISLVMDLGSINFYYLLYTFHIPVTRYR